MRAVMQGYYTWGVMMVRAVAQGYYTWGLRVVSIVLHLMHVRVKKMTVRVLCKDETRCKVDCSKHCDAKLYIR